MFPEPECALKPTSKLNMIFVWCFDLNNIRIWFVTTDVGSFVYYLVFVFSYSSICYGYEFTITPQAQKFISERMFIVTKEYNC